jgi:hypothetical protein
MRLVILRPGENCRLWNTDCRKKKGLVFSSDFEQNRFIRRTSHRPKFQEDLQGHFGLLL